MTSSTSLRIDQRRNQRPLSKAQITFNSLIGKIESSRALLARWQSAVDNYEKTRVKDFEPLFDKFTAQQVAFVKALDALLSRSKFAKAERRAAAEYIYEMVDSLLETTEDDALKILYKKYGGTDVDADDVEVVAEMNAAMKNMFGMGLEGDNGPISPEEAFRKFAEQMDKAQQREEQQAQHHEKKKSPKQLARDAKLQQEADLTNLSLREIYRKLVSALHPDREPDPVERERKTALMQRVNQAYDKKNLLLLLELQLELEHIDANAIAGMPDERVKRFNKILKEQLGELKIEIEHFQMGAYIALDQAPFDVVSPESLMPTLRQDIADMKREIARSTEQSVIIQNPVSFKLWLKQLQREMKVRRANRRSMDDFDFPF